MLKISNGFVNGDAIAAVLKVGSNNEIILISGQRLTVSQADADALTAEMAPADAPAPKEGKAK